jgi:protein O-mannosyl-transferase
MKQAQPKGISVNAALIAIVAIVFISFLPTFSNGYVYWDDPDYILHNPLMTAPLKVMFFGGTSSYYLANYHPLTILVYTIEHSFWGSNMMGYHAVSLLLHIANSLLVFSFIYHLLSKKNVMIPLVTALLFGVHPMHVESVAWASELKDVLYTFFFLASLTCYVLYLQNAKSLKYLVVALILFLLSLISKGQAVTLPLSFLLVDFFFKRKATIGMAIDKVPFFALSLIFGVIAMKAQNSAITHDASQIFQTFFWGIYGLCLYLFKFILPVNLSGLYPYPYGADHSIPIIVYASPVFIVILLGIVYKFFRTNKFVLFGVFFFLLNIFTVLKFVPVGDAIMADRYSYIPYIGLFFIVAYGFNKLLNNPPYKLTKKVIQYAGVALLVLLSSLTWARVTVWKDSYSFWGDTIKKNGDYWRAYYCIGQEYYNKGDYASAVKYFSGGIKNDKYCPPTVYMWRGITYMEKLNKLDSAIADFKAVLNFGNKADPSQIDGRLNLGLAYYRKGMFDDALKIYNELIAMAPDDITAYFQRGLVYQYKKQPQADMALADYNKAIEMNPQYADAYLNRGSLYVDMLGKYDLGIADFNKALELQPANVDAIINRGIAYYKQGNFDAALNNYNQAIGKTTNNGRVYFLEALAYAGKKEYAKALQIAEQAQKAGVNVDAGLLQQWKSHH